MDIFKQGTKVGLRFDSFKGASLTIEDLWQLNLESLDSIAKTVNKKLKEEAEESFVSPSKNTKSVEFELKLEILKEVIADKIAINQEKKTRLDRMAQLTQLKALAAQKANEALANQSLDEIRKQIEEMEAVL